LKKCFDCGSGHFVLDVECRSLGSRLSEHGIGCFAVDRWGARYLLLGGHLRHLS